MHTAHTTMLCHSGELEFDCLDRLHNPIVPHHLALPEPPRRRRQRSALEGQGLRHLRLGGRELLLGEAVRVHGVGLVEDRPGQLLGLHGGGDELGPLLGLCGGNGDRAGKKCSHNRDHSPSSPHLPLLLSVLSLLPQRHALINGVVHRVESLDGWDERSESHGEIEREGAFSTC